MNDRRAGRIGAELLPGLFAQPLQVHGLHVALDGLGALWHRTVDPGGDRHRPSAQQIATEARRYFQRQGDVAAAHPLVQVHVVGNRRQLDEVARTGKLQRIVVADGCLVAIEDGIAQVFHVHGDAEAHDEHQNQCAGQCECGAYRVAL
ncbi:hypothetical protein D3C81_1351160 [compost metagenome]